MKTCPGCNGKGEYQLLGPVKKCEECKGTGQVPDNHVVGKTSDDTSPTSWVRLWKVLTTEEDDPAYRELINKAMCQSYHLKAFLIDAYHRDAFYAQLQQHYPAQQWGRTAYEFYACENIKLLNLHVPQAEVSPSRAKLLPKLHGDVVRFHLGGPLTFSPKKQSSMVGLAVYECDQAGQLVNGSPLYLRDFGQTYQLDTSQDFTLRWDRDLFAERNLK